MTEGKHIAYNIMANAGMDIEVDRCGKMRHSLAIQNAIILHQNPPKLNYIIVTLL